MQKRIRGIMVKTADRAMEKFRKEIRYDNRDRKTFVARNEYGGL